MDWRRRTIQARNQEDIAVVLKEIAAWTKNVVAKTERSGDSEIQRELKPRGPVKSE